MERLTLSELGAWGSPRSTQCGSEFMPQAFILCLRRKGSTCRHPRGRGGPWRMRQTIARPPPAQPPGLSLSYRRRLWEERCLSDAEPNGTWSGRDLLSTLYETCRTLQQSCPNQETPLSRKASADGARPMTGRLCQLVGGLSSRRQKESLTCP